MSRKVFVAMSGGVDSSVAALLLQRQGYEVVGATFKLFTDEAEAGLGYDTLSLASREPRAPCCSLESVERARAVCDVLGVTHYVMNFTADFRDTVIDPFVREYAAGRTPNPCVCCNRHLKFDRFLRKALAIGADFIATGHHARIEHREDRPCRLFPGRDSGKDQSYALSHLNQSTLPHVLLPVGEHTKEEVRAVAREAGLPTAETPESQDICFVLRGHFSDFLRRHGLPDSPGHIMDRAGHVLGEHRGLHRYTVGQRKQLGVSGGRRLYVIEKRVADHALVVGDHAEVVQAQVRIEDVNWCDLPAGAWPDDLEGMELKAMLRYRQRPVGARVERAEETGQRLELSLSRPAVAAPGQLLTMYDVEDGHVIGGGTIA
jgi:tRNA-specific 2-thiouridylase